MKHLLPFLLIYGFILASNSIVAQDTLTKKAQHHLVVEAEKTSVHAKSLAPLQELVSSGKITSDAYLAMAYMAQVSVLKELHKGHFKKYVYRDSVVDSILLEVLGAYENAVRACEPCSIVYKKDRYDFMVKLAPNTSMVATDLRELKSAGYKSEKEGTWINFQGWQGKDTWLGASFAPFGSIHPSSKLQYQNPKNGKRETMKRIPPTAINVLTFSYSRNLHQAENDFSLSLMQLNAPIVLNFSTFGFQTGKDTEGKKLNKGWYYRPEIGIGFGHLSISYAYNLMFKKAARASSERHLMQVRYAFVVPK